MVTLKTIEDRSTPVGDCLEWQNYISTTGQPMVRHAGQAVYVRRLVVQLEGREPEYEWVSRVSCKNNRCVLGAHITTHPADQHAKHMSKLVDYNRPLRIARLQKAAESRRKATDECVMRVLTDPRPAVHVAKDLGISPSLARKIRAGKMRRQVSASVNPFAGLMR